MKTHPSTSRFFQLLLAACLALTCFGSLQAQKTEAHNPSVIVPIDLPAITAALIEAPHEGSAKAKSKPLTLALPMPDGQERQFTIEQNDVVSGEFAAQFPELKTYSMRAADDPTVHGRLTVSPAGVRSSVFAKEGWVEIAPVDVHDPVMHKISLLKGEANSFMCGASGELVTSNLQEKMMMTTTPWSNGATKRTLRMAIVATFHYYEANGSSVSATQTALAAVVNNLSAIYERELAMTFTISPPPFIYTNTNAPYPFFAFPENQRTVRSGQAVGVKFPDPSKYDVGHVFHGGTYNIQNWGGGGACTSCLCDDAETPGYSPGRRKGEGFSMLVGNDPP